MIFPCNVQCARKVHAWVHTSKFVFLTDIVCPRIGNPRSVKKIYALCQGAVQGSVHARCVRACTLRQIFRFFFSTDIVCPHIRYTTSV